ncbi:CHAT domain-containing protein [Mycena sp. CBHHK59/15]|nr:CHAT domain-containing protein [Mycena sp. CBHHK59/15]
MDSTTVLPPPTLEAGQDINQEALDVFDLAHSALEECKGASNISSLNTSIYLLRWAIYLLGRDAQAGNPEVTGLSEALGLLATALLTRFSFTSQLDDVNLAFAARFQAAGYGAFGTNMEKNLELMGYVSDVEDDRGQIIALASSILNDFYQSMRSDNIATAISLHRKAPPLRQPSHPKRFKSLEELSDALLNQFRLTGQREDLYEAIFWLHELRLLLPNRTSLLCAALLHQTGTVIEFAVLQEVRQLLATAAKRDEKGIESLQSGLQSFYFFQWSRYPWHLTAAISSLQLAESHLSWGHVDRGTTVGKLAMVLLMQFQISGDSVDLDNAIDMFRDALALPLPPGTDRCWLLNNLASTLFRRFQEAGGARDLDDAISMGREAVALLPPAHPERCTYLNNLANIHQTRFQRKRNTRDLEAAIALYNEALGQLPISHRDHSSCISALAAAHCELYLEGHTNDLDRAIELYQNALALYPDSHPSHPRFLINLASCLGSRFTRNGDALDFEGALELHQRVLSLLQPPNPMRGYPLMYIAEQHIQMYLRAPGATSLDEAAAAFREVSIYLPASLSLRFDAATKWASYADSCNHRSALEAYHRALELLPQIVMLGLDLQFGKEITPTSVRGLASTAGACAIRLNDLSTAVEFLELGRSVIWSTILQILPALDDLVISDPALAWKVSTTLNGFKFDREIFSPPVRHLHESRFPLPEARLELNAEWLKALRDVRQGTELDAVLRKKSFTALQDAAINGPVVLLNVGSPHFTALIVTFGNEPKSVPLPDMTLEAASDLIDLLPTSSVHSSAFADARHHTEGLGSCSGVQNRLMGNREGALDLNSNDAFEFLLAQLWRMVVKPVLRVLDLKKSVNPHRLWWCPTGILTFLPIHAAGLYGKHGSDCASDYIISSYSPTLSALLDPPSNPVDRFQMTVLIQPHTPLLSLLPGTETELTQIQKRVPEQWLTSLGGVAPTTVDLAKANIRKSSIVHFACHGTQDLANPLDSSLILTDGLLTINHIMHGRHGSSKSPGSVSTEKSMSLAFLSACETAKGDERIPDEAMHLAATLLFAGFRTVVGTMWTMDDRDGPKIADTFYEHLFRDCNATSDQPVLPDLKDAARALHFAVKKLRDDPNVSFQRWVPFVHYGL